MVGAVLTAILFHLALTSGAADSFSLIPSVRQSEPTSAGSHASCCIFASRTNGRTWAGDPDTTRTAQPCFGLRPGVLSGAKRTIRMTDHERQLRESFAVTPDAGRDLTSGLRTPNHDFAHGRTIPTQIAQRQTSVYSGTAATQRKESHIMARDRLGLVHRFRGSNHIKRLG